MKNLNPKISSSAKYIKLNPLETNDFKKLRTKIDINKGNFKKINIVFYLSTPPSAYQFIIKNLKTTKEAINAIKTMEVRGAPLIGATAAYGMVLAIIENNDQSYLKKTSLELINSRPTAIILKWAVDRMMKKLSGVNSKEILNIAINEANDICEEDISFCKNIGLNGLIIIEEIYE